MKLRIQGNSIRLRLGQSEVRRLGMGETVEECAVFGTSKQERFTYSLCAAPDAADVSATFADRRVVVRVPRRMIHQWATTDQVGIEALQHTGDGDGLSIVIEKDFECVHAPPGQSQEDAFPNPQLAAACPPAGGRERSI